MKQISKSLTSKSPKKCGSNLKIFSNRFSSTHKISSPTHFSSKNKFVLKSGNNFSKINSTIPRPFSKLPQKSSFHQKISKTNFFKFQNNNNNNNNYIINARIPIKTHFTQTSSHFKLKNLPHYSTPLLFRSSRYSSRSYFTFEDDEDLFIDVDDDDDLEEDPPKNWVPKTDNDLKEELYPIAEIDWTPPENITTLRDPKTGNILWDDETNWDVEQMKTLSRHRRWRREELKLERTANTWIIPKRYNTTREDTVVNLLGPKYPKHPIPEPRYGITKDIFLHKIGRGCSEYADKFASWEELFSLTRWDMRHKEIPLHQRRWILAWRWKYCQGVEPYELKFKSKANRHKILRKQRFEDYKNRSQKAWKERKKREEDKKEWKEKLQIAADDALSKGKQLDPLKINWNEI